jgi:hypothetical protein
VGKRIPSAVSCAGCAHAFEVDVVDNVPIDREPALLEEVLQERLNRFACPRCAAPMQVEKQLLYTDFARGHFVGVFPPEQEARFISCAALVEASFQHAIVVEAPPIVAAAAPRFEVRVVFGLAELREKLICWNNDLDDRAVELLKMDVLADRPELVARGVVALVVDGVTAEENAIALVSRPFPRDLPRPPPVALLVPREIYDAVVATVPEPERAKRFQGPYVNALRFFKSDTPKSVE